MPPLITRRRYKMERHIVSILSFPISPITIYRRRYDSLSAAIPPSVNVVNCRIIPSRYLVTKYNQLFFVCVGCCLSRGIEFNGCFYFAIVTFDKSSQLLCQCAVNPASVRFLT